MSGDSYRGIGPLVYFPGTHFWAHVPLLCACGKRYMTWEGLRACEWRHSNVEDMRHA